MQEYIYINILEFSYIEYTEILNIQRMQNVEICDFNIQYGFLRWEVLRPPPLT